MRALTLATLLTAAALPALAAEPPYGHWLTEKKGVIVDLYECGDAVCGRTVWLKKMTFKDGRPRLDAKNPDPSLRGRHWCGIEVISGVAPAGAGRWKGGVIYDPKTGETFDFDIERNGAELKVRGYLGVPLLGKSETWTRANLAGKELCAGG